MLRRLQLVSIWKPVFGAPGGGAVHAIWTGLSANSLLKNALRIRVQVAPG